MNSAFFHSFNECLLSSYYVLGFIGGSGDMVEKIDKCGSCSRGNYI